MFDPRVVEKPRDNEKTEKLTDKFPGIFPDSVVTHSMIEEQSNDKELLGLFKIALTPVEDKKGECWLFNQG